MGFARAYHRVERPASRVAVCGARSLVSRSMRAARKPATHLRDTNHQAVVRCGVHTQVLYSTYTMNYCTLGTVGIALLYVQSCAHVTIRLSVNHAVNLIVTAC